MALNDIQRRRARRGLPSRPQPLIFPQLGQIIEGELLPPELPVDIQEVEAQPARIAQIFVYGPMMIFQGLGRSPPPWARTGMIILGVGTIVYALYQYFEVERRKNRAGVQGLGGLGGPWDRYYPSMYTDDTYQARWHTPAEHLGELPRLHRETVVKQQIR